MWEWLRDDKNQGALKLLGGAFAAIVIGGWAYFQWYQSQHKNPEVNAATVVEHTICHGQYERNCLPHDIYLSCDTTFDDWRLATCKLSSVMEGGAGPGGKCGYSTLVVACLPK